MTHRIQYNAVAAILLAFSIGVSPAVARDTKNKDGSSREKDSSKSVPHATDKIKEAGNELSKGLSKAANATVDAVNKVMKGHKDKDK
jgi:hypothetical protein